MILKQITDEELNYLYWGEGLRCREIAERLGCSASSVCLRMKESGIKARTPHNYPPTEKQKAYWAKAGKCLSKLPQTKAAIKETGKKNRGRRYNAGEFGGHEKTMNKGYVLVYMPDHPAASKSGYVMKHRLVMERSIGRYLREDECVHHINHKRNDNRIENLQLMTKTEHAALHMMERNKRKEKK